MRQGTNYSNGGGRRGNWDKATNEGDSDSVERIMISLQRMH